MRLIFLLTAAASLLAAEVDFSLDLTRTPHIYTGGEEPIPYTAITGTLPVSDPDGRLLAELFFIAYIADEEEDRPITFVFPGGPGGSCEAEVLCTIAPRRLQTPQEGKTLLPPYKIVDNRESLFPWTDLVFVDPVTTGYSRFLQDLEEEDKDPFFSTDGDIAILGEFVQTFISYFQRWNSPKYLFGISYGTVRCCGLSEYLRSYGFGLHGVILLGSAIDYGTLVDGQRLNILPDSLLIPTFAATAWYHGRLWPEANIEEVVDHARRFVYDEYAPFLLQPNRLGPRELDAFYGKLGELIGLKEETVRRYLGRFDEALYTTEFMGSERKVIGGFDTRYIGDLSAIRRHSIEEDPSYKDMLGIYCAFNDYLQKELETSRPFETYSSFMERDSWNFSSYDSPCWPEVLQRLRRTLVWNPVMRVFSGSGYYDCRTPFAATEFCFNHMDLPSSYKKNFRHEYYEAGHGFVFDLPSLQKLQKDLIQFYTQ